MPHLPQRTIFHTGLLYTYGHTSLYKALTSHKGETKPEHVTCHTGLNATQVLSPPRTIIPQIYFVTGLFVIYCRTIVCIVTTQVYFIKRYKGQKKKYCTPHLPQRTIFHTGLLHTYSHTNLYKALTSHKGETKPEHVTCTQA